MSIKIRQTLNNVYLDFNVFNSLNCLMSKYTTKVALEQRVCEECGEVFDVNTLFHDDARFCSYRCANRRTGRKRHLEAEKRNSEFVKQNDVKEYMTYMPFFMSFNKAYNMPYDLLEEEFYNYSLNIMGRVNELKLKEKNRRNYIMKSLKLTYKTVLKKYLHKQQHEIGFEDLTPSIKGKYIEEIEYD